MLYYRYNKKKRKIKMNESKQLINDFINLWNRLINLNTEITFEDGVIHNINEGVEVCWNHDGVSETYNI